MTPSKKATKRGHSRRVKMTPKTTELLALMKRLEHLQEDFTALAPKIHAIAKVLDATSTLLTIEAQIEEEP